MKAMGNLAGKQEVEIGSIAWLRKEGDPLKKRVKCLVLSRIS